jgi:septum formation protein
VIQLSSQSIRRYDILRQFDIPFIVINNRLKNEPSYQGGTIKAYVRWLSKQKGCAAVSKTNDWILTADTIVVLKDTVLGKPTSRDHATQILRSLSAKRHSVITGICLTDPQTGRQFSRTETTSILFSTLTQGDIDNYIDKNMTLDKAGGYGIQDVPTHFITHRSGCYYNVMGLPIRLLLRLCRDYDIL